ncbi:MAG: isopentenyl-diphosphate Delta-isomerase [Mucilaginibacter sp.]
MENVILVDEDDNAHGVMEKLQAHRLGELHRAISVFVFNSAGEFLLQRRAAGKYHSAGKWSNTCCSHPRPGEANLDAALRRLKEEMGIHCHLDHQFSFIYRAELENGLIEHEYDHVFMGITDIEPVPDPTEVAGYHYMNSSDLAADISQNPDSYTEWFKLCFERIGKRLFTT